MSSIKQKYFTLILLIIAGELIFSLPFHIPRFFKPAILETFQITNTNLGDAFALYGLCALLCYFPSGYIADKYSPRILIFLSLLSTGIGGIYFATLPKPTALPYLYAFWGVTTILFFWGALIKYTNDWGGLKQQGRAFGYLEAGRGLIASIFSSFAFLLFYFSSNSETFSLQGMQSVILFYALVTVTLSFIVLMFLKDGEENKYVRPRNNNKSNFSFYPVSLIAVIIISAYCGFRSLDNIGLYLVEIFGLTPVEASGFVTVLGYLRIVAALVAGIIADRITSIKLVIGLFVISAIGQGILAGINPQTFYFMAFANATLIIVFVATVSLRAVYFSLLKHSNIPSYRTGLCVGIVSLVGFTPDIFFHSMAGRIIDAEPGITGYHNYYLVTTVISILGLLASLKLSLWMAKKARLNNITAFD